MARLADEGKAFEIIKDKWTLISDTLADEALKAARSRKKDGKSLVATCTAAGIAYDKRWSKATSDSQEVDVPATLLASVSSKLTANQSVTAKVAVLGQDCDPDPDMLRQAMEDLLGF